MKTRISTILVIIVLSIFVFSKPGFTKPQDIYEIKGINELDTAARRKAAIEIILRINELGFKEEKSYRQLVNDIWYKGKDISSCNKQLEETKLSKKLLWPGESKLPEDMDCQSLYFRLSSYYEFEPKFVKEVSSRYIPKKVVTKYEKEQQIKKDKAKNEASLKIKQTIGIGFIIIIPIILGYAIARRKNSKNTIRWDALDPTIFYVGGIRHRLYHVTGSVRSPQSQKTVKTYVSGGGSDGKGGTNPVSSSNVETDHLTFFLQTKDGQEQSFVFENFTLPMREGHIVSIAWAIREGNERGPYIAMRNHSTDTYILQMISLLTRGGIALSGLTGIIVMIVLLFGIIIIPIGFFFFSIGIGLELFGRHAGKGILLIPVWFILGPYATFSFFRRKTDDEAFMHGKNNIIPLLDQQAKDF